ncbi:MAG: type II/IV secretion system ATPase subunit [Candidatus Hecatellaceae archaeon]
MAQYLAELIKSSRPPQLVEKLSRDMASIRAPNLLYPVGDPVYIHIYPDPQSGSLKYHPVEPRIAKNREQILSDVERILALNIDAVEVPEEASAREQVLNRLIDRLFPVNARLKTASGLELRIDRDLHNRLKYELYCEKIGVSILEPMIRDPFIEDIHCSGLGPIFLHHKIFGHMESTISFESLEELDGFVMKLSEFVGKPVSHRSPIVDAKLPDGSRINIVFGEDISQRGSNFTIRKFATKPLSIIELIKFGTMSSILAAYLWLLLEERMSIWICGETASGKTTTLSAITAFIPPSAKIVSIEEVPEVHVPHENWVREVVRETGNATSEETGAVSMFQLLKAALRQRPTYIIVGEIRGQEGAVAFQAMQTGHPVLATFHAASVNRLIQRLTGSPINIPKTYVDNLNAVIIQSAVHNPKTGRYERRVLSVNEILGYEPAEQQFNFVEVITWEPSTDSFEFRGLGSSYLLENKIAVMKGISKYELKKIYEELELRAKILEYMLKLGILDYYEVWRNLVWIHNVGVEEAYEKLRQQVLSKHGSVRGEPVLVRA